MVQILEYVEHRFNYKHCDISHLSHFSATSVSNFPPLLLRRNVPLDICGVGKKPEHDVYL